MATLSYPTLIPVAVQWGRSAEKLPEGMAHRSRSLAATRKRLCIGTRRRSLQNSQDMVRVVATLFAIERPLLRSYRLAGGGMPPLSESMPAESSSPALPISARRSPNAHEPRRILLSCSRQGPPQALHNSSQETPLQHMRFVASNFPQ